MLSTGQRLDSPSTRFVTAISSAMPTFFIHRGWRSLMERGTIAERVWARARLMGRAKRTDEDPLELPWDLVCSAAVAAATASPCLRDLVSWPRSLPVMIVSLWVCGLRSCRRRKLGSAGRVWYDDAGSAFQAH